MTEEELKQKAKDYANDWLWFVKGLEIVHKTDPKPEYIRIEEAYIAGAMSREKQIEIDAEQIRALQKQNGELTDKVKELEVTNKRISKECHRLVDTLEKKQNKIVELLGKIAFTENDLNNVKAQIEKMKKELDNARENANKQEQWEIYSVLNDIYNDNFEVITSVSN